MVEVTMDELRELSRRARRAHGRGALVVVLGMAALPMLVLANSLAPRWTGWTATLLLAAVGAAFVAYAHAVGQSRGAFRRLFRALKDEGRARRVKVEDAVGRPTRDAATPRGPP